MASANVCYLGTLYPSKCCPTIVYYSSQAKHTLQGSKKSISPDHVLSLLS